MIRDQSVLTFPERNASELSLFCNLHALSFSFLMYRLMQVSCQHKTLFKPTAFAEHFSIGEYELHLLESGAFIFYGTERLLDYIPPHKLASMNLPSKWLKVKLLKKLDSRFLVL